jgi:UDP-2,4-diacetamido-2,4,6-trideoxy-beta-L-altropyranose hydrolase
MDLNESTRGSASKTPIKILIRTDSSNRIGTGHVSRCLRVANELRKRGGEVTFVCAPLEGNVSHWISDSGFGVLSLSAFGDEPLQPIESAWPIEIQEVDSIATRGFAHFMEAEVVLVDHYSLNSTWEKRLNDQDIKVIALDDLEERSHSASCVIRPGLPNYSSNDSDQGPSRAISFSGLRYAIVPTEFCEIGSSRGLNRESSEVRVLIYFGGVDEGNFSESIVDSLVKAMASGLLPQMQVELVLGARNRHARELQVRYGNNPFVNLHESSSSLAPLMAKCDLAIGAGGVTALERVAAGLPSVSFSLAPNQIGANRSLDELGVAVSAGNSGEYQEDKFISMLQDVLDGLADMEKRYLFPKGVIDCLGASRIAETIMPSQWDDINIRRATHKDMDLYFGWVNEPLVRLQSIETNSIPYEDHVNWYQTNLNDPGVVMLLFEVESLPIGQVRFVQEADFWELNYSLDEIVRGRGWGKHMVKLALEWLSANGLSGTVNARVKNSNQASLKALLDCGFREIAGPASQAVLTLQMEIK